MEIRSLDISYEEAFQILPAGVRGLLRLKGTHVYACLKGDLMVGIYVLSLSLDGSGDYCINYIEAENDELIIEMINDAEGRVRLAERDYLRVRLQGDGETLLRLHRIIEGLSFSPVSLNGHYMLYALEDLYDSELGSSLEKLSEISSTIKSFKELQRELRNEARNIEKLRGMVMPAGVGDAFLLNRYYVEKDRITGIMHAIGIGEGVTVIKDFYIDGKAGSKAAIIPTLLASLFYGKKDMGRDMVVFCFEGEPIYEGIIKIFGEGIANELVCEYIKEIL